MKLVYVAGPISKGPLVMNVVLAHNIGYELLKLGLSVIVPHGSAFWGNQVVLGVAKELAFVPEILPLGTVANDWYRMDLEIVRRCDAVYRIPGESVGADLEVAEARKHNKPVFTSFETIKEWAEQE